MTEKIAIFRSREDTLRLATMSAMALFFLPAALSHPKTHQEARGESHSSAQSVIERNIRKSWQDFKEKKADAYAAFLDNDFTAVEIDGKAPHDKKASVSEVAAGTLNDYSLNDIKVTVLAANVALATYTANTDGTMPDGKKIHETVSVTEVWVKRAGSWKSLRYHESELK